METDFKKNVFDEKLFQYSLELLELLEKLRGAMTSDLPAEHGTSVLRKTLSDAFATSHSLSELHTFVRTLNQQNLTDFQSYLPAFFENANLMKRHDQELLEDYLMTLRHLSELKNFRLWEDFFKSLHNLGSQSQQVVHEYLMTVRHLVNPNSHFTSWEEFFKSLNALASQTQQIVLEYLMTVRHLVNLSSHFTSWEGFFKSALTISSHQELNIPFFISVRHVLNYLKNSESIDAMMRTLAGQTSPSAFEAFSYGQLESKRWLIKETRAVRGSSWGTVFILAGWIGSLAQLIFDSTEISTEKIRSFDIDGLSCKLAEKLNNTQVLDQWKFKAVNMDISLMKYPTEYFVKRHDGSACELRDQPDLVINTSCEHIENLRDWWNKIPTGTAVVLQNNNAFHIANHINCVESLEEFKKQLPLAKYDFAGELPLADYTRYMLIGEK